MDDDLRSEYDLAALKSRTRGKYLERYRAGTNLVRLDDDVAGALPDDQSVNEALSLLLKLAQDRLSQPRR